MVLQIKQKQVMSHSYQVAMFVNWNDEVRINKLKKNLKKVLVKSLKSKNISFSRLNSFLIATVQLNSQLESEKRIEVESRVKQILTEYAKVLNKDFKKHVQYNGDSSIYEASFRHQISNPNDLKKLLHDLQHEFVDRMQEEISKLISYASISIWDSPGHHKDRIVLPGMVVTLEEESEIELSSIVDELILVNFANYFIPFSDELISKLLDGMMNLLSLLENKSVSALPKDTLRLLRNFIGVISGLQESLKLLRRQAVRLCQVVSEMDAELQNFNSPELDFWVKQMDGLLCEGILEKISKLEETVVATKPRLRTMLTENEVDTLAWNNSLTHIIYIKSLTNTLVQWVHNFSELPSFTTMESGIAFESVENETYIQKNGAAILETSTLFKLYRRGGSTVYALRGIDMHVDKGEFLMIQGPSGAGKTTLLNMLAGLDNPDRGTVFFDTQDLSKLRDGKKSKIRRMNFSFIFQSYALIPHLTAIENLKVPVEMAGLSKELLRDIQKLLDEVGIGEYSTHKPAHLSGGQMQRLGIARALISKPRVIFADEPTGDLDVKTGIQVMDLLKRYHEETGVTIVMVSHDPEVVKYASRVITIEDGQIIN